MTECLFSVNYNVSNNTIDLYHDDPFPSGINSLKISHLHLKSKFLCLNFPVSPKCRRHRLSLAGQKCLRAFSPLIVGPGNASHAQISVLFYFLSTSFTVLHKMSV